MKIKLVCSTLALSVASLLLGACTIEGNASYKGGGELPSSGGLGKAYVQVDADTCDGNENAKGSFTYNDKTALDWESGGGIAITGTILKSGICTNQGSGGSPDDRECDCPGWPAVTGSYTSTNPNYPGEGTYYVCFYSQADGPAAGAPIRATLVQRVSLTGGPYENYENHGTLRGTIATRACGT